MSNSQIVGEGKPKRGEGQSGSPTGPLRPSRDDREARRLEIEKCFKAGFSREQICRLSTSWTWPIKWPQQVSEILRQLHLVRSSVVQPHMRETNDMLIDVILECHRNGWRVEFWEKEHDLGEFRADFFVDVRKGKRIHFYYGEMQISDLKQQTWLAKLSPYWEKFKEKSYLQHVLIRCKGSYNERRAVEAINELVGDRTTTRLFLISKGQRWMNRFGDLRELVE